MALINCPECGKEVSNAAESCPHCGYPIKNYIQEAQQKRIEFERKQKQIKQEKTDKKSISNKQNNSNDLCSKPKYNVDENRAKKIDKIGNVLFGIAIVAGSICAICMFGVFIGFFLDSSEYMLAVGCGFFGGGLIAIICIPIIKSLELKKRVANGEFADLEEAKKAAEIERQEADKRSAEIEKRKAEEQKKREQEIYKAQHPKCPHCGGNNTSRITTTGKVISTAALGLASSTIGKQYQCYDCKHKW